MRKNYILALVLATFGMQFYAFPTEEGNRDNLTSKKTDNLPNTYTVTSTADSGAGSLREAIGLANGNSGADIIQFNIGGGGAQTINLNSEIVIDDPITIDGGSLITIIGVDIFELNAGSDGSLISNLAFESTTANTGIGMAINTADNLTISTNTFKDFNEGIRIYLTSDSNFENNSTSGTMAHGIRVQGFWNATDSNNTFNQNTFIGTTSHSMFFESGNYNGTIITNNVLRSTASWALYHANGTPADVSGNNFSGSYGGVYMRNVNNFELSAPDSNGDPISGEPNSNTWGAHVIEVIRYEYSTNITIDDWPMADLFLDVSSKSALVLNSITGATIQNNDFTGGFLHAIKAIGNHDNGNGYISGVTINSNDLSGTTSDAIQLSSRNNGNNIITNNTINNAGGWAIKFTGTPSEISGNNFTGSAGGVYLSNVSNFELSAPDANGDPINGEPNSNTWGQHTNAVIEYNYATNVTINDWDMSSLFVSPAGKTALKVSSFNSSTIENNDFSGGFQHAILGLANHDNGHGYVNGATINNNDCSGTTNHAIYIISGSGGNNSITNNTINNAGGWAIHFRGTPAEISGNNFRGSVGGVLLSHTSNFELSAPDANGDPINGEPNSNIWGQHVNAVIQYDYGTNITIDDWNMSSLFASTAGKTALTVNTFKNSIVQNNDFSGGFKHGFVGNGFHDNGWGYIGGTTIHNNNFSGTTSHAIWMRSVGNGNNIITDNNLTNSAGWGIMFYGTPGQISGNDFTGSTNGLFLEATSTFTLGSNTFVNNSGTAIGLGGNQTPSSNVTIENLTITGSGAYGVYSYYGNNNVVDNVSICSKDTGIYMSFGSNNQILNSKISSSTNYGIHLVSSANNTIINTAELAGNGTDILDNGSGTVTSNLTVLAQSYWCPGDPPIDQTAPVITLLGDNPQNIDFTDAYVEANATALDDTDGDLTANITIDASAVNVNVIGSYSVTYEVTDAAGNTGIATRTVNVNNVPEPTIFGLTTSVIQNSVNNVFDVLANDNFGTNGPNATHPLTLQNGTLNNASDQGGIVSVEDNGTPNDLTDDVIHYSPPKDYNGPDFITYTITDSKGLAKTGTINITVTPLATVSTPTANDDTATVDQASSDNIINVLANDEPGLDGYINGGLTMTNGTLVSASAKGAAISIDNKNTDDTTDDVFLYTPPVGFSGTDTFQYTITDGSGDASTATVNVTVNAVNVGYQPDSATVDQNSSDNIIDVMANDPDDATFGSNDTRFLIESVDHLTGTTAKGGTVALETYNTANTADDVILYTPRAGFTGTDTFNYVPGNNRNTLVPVTVTVTEVVVVNGSPSATDDIASATQGGNAITIDVLDNDDYGSDGPNATHQLTFSNGSTSNASANGAAIEVVNNEIEYTPTATFSGTDTFTYVITDADGEADSATVTVTVTSGGATAFVPEAVDDAATVSINSGATVIDVIANDEPGADGYIDGGLTMTNGTLSSASTKGGAISIDNKGTGDVSDDEFSYTPPAGFSGTDTFQYTITDNSGDADTATVTITVVASATPTAVNDAFSVVEDSGANAINVLSNDLAGANPPVTVVSYDALGANGGSVVINGDGTGTYTPPASFTGTDTFEYTISTSGGSDTGTVTITITSAAAVNSTPTANDDNVTSGVTQGGSSVDIDVTDNDDYGTDGPNATHPLTFTNGAMTNASSNGAALEVVNGQIRYTPTATFSGTDTFTYVITDEDGEADRATVTITVASSGSGGGGGGGAVSTPTAVDDSFTVNQNSSTNSIDVLNNDTIGSDGYISGHGLRLQGGLSERFTDNGGFLRVNDFGTPNDASDDRIEYTPVNGFSGTETFVYTITDATGDASTATVTMTVNAIPKVKTTETSDFTNSFSVYPNPSNGLVRTAIESATSGKANVYLMDVTGKIIYKSEVNLVKGKNNLDFNFNVSQGVMFLKIIGNSNYGIQKVIFE